ncbi:hypothetical protein ABZ890_45705 [Streptomyces sp. NPDC046984]|uniref:hypothetical protein n=1 Tax=Streptomyces sp. NPDC046984 TaxID=3155138 RepID=UPI0033F14F7E
MRVKNAAAVAIAAVGLIGASLATAPAASADYSVPVGNCPRGFACLYYHSWEYANSHWIDSTHPNYGANFATASNISDFQGWKFSAEEYGKDGAGLSVKNNAAFAANLSLTASYRVYYNSGYNCSVACQTIGINSYDGLAGIMANNNASGKFL